MNQTQVNKTVQSTGKFIKGKGDFHNIQPPAAIWFNQVTSANVQQ